MKFVVLACLAAAAAAAPQQLDIVQPAVQLLRDERQGVDGSNFRYVIEADNGVYVEAAGSPGSLGQTNVQGVYRMISADGIIHNVHYVADEFGFQPQSDLLPTPHPLPAHAIEQLRIAEEQRAAGITFE